MQNLSIAKQNKVKTMPGFELKKEDLLKGLQTGTSLGAAVQPGGEMAGIDNFLLQANSILQSVNKLMENPAVAQILQKVTNPNPQQQPQKNPIQQLSPAQAAENRRISVPADIIGEEKKPEVKKDMSEKVTLDKEQLYQYIIQLLEYGNSLQPDMRISTLLTLAKTNKGMITKNLDKWIEDNAKPTG